MNLLEHPLPDIYNSVGVGHGLLRTAEEADSGNADMLNGRSLSLESDLNSASNGTRSLRSMLVTEPGVDGVFRHVEALAQYLMAQGHRVDLAYSAVRGSDRLTKLVAQAAAVGGRVMNLAVSNVPGPRDLPALFRLRRLVAEAAPDVIHAHSSKAGALVRALRALGVRQPLYYTPHAYYGMCAPSGLKARIFGGIERVLGRVGTTFNLSGCELAYAERTLHVPRKQLRLIPNPVDTRRFVPASSEEKLRLRQELGLPDDALLLGCVGRLAFQKDPLTLYRSLAVAMRQVKNLWLYHLGTGELADDCARLAAELGVKDRIIRRDYLSDPLPFYQAIDAAILPSRYEGLSFAVLEAMACDLPVIVSEALGNLDFLNLGLSHCWSAPKENPELMGQAIMKWATGQPRPSNHRVTAEHRFSQETCFGAVVAEYQSQVRR
ncbi:MAG: glycosyltransferase family 4 protein [Verrucomicrobia bacterium]|nr:glycosyltransferase family 4 protein [Verrucomicrobiota bacterium]